MSKSVRIREHLYEEIERLAKTERRSLISQLEVLLEQALLLKTYERVAEIKPEDIPNLPPFKSPPVSADAQPRDIPTRTVSPDEHFKPYPKPSERKR